MIFFTICACNFLPYAIVLYENLKEHHGESDFIVFLADRSKGFNSKSLPFKIVPLEDVGIPLIEEMIKNYNVSEFCTSIKPFCISYLFETKIDDEIVYLDPDIYVVDRMMELEQTFKDGAEIVLTPHITSPAEFSEFRDNQHLKLGVYNLGFFAVRHTDRTERIIRWWARRLEHECVIDIANGLFVDQKWADLFPCFVENTKIVRHPGYNVAYWNLHERKITGTRGSWKANQQPLRFIHFSGVSIDDSTMISRHSNAYTIENSHCFGEILQIFRQRILKARFKEFGALPFGFFWESADKINLHAPGAADLEVSEWRKPSTFLFSSQIFDSIQYDKFLSRNKRIFDQQRKVEFDLIKHNDGTFNHDGYCYLCAQDVTFVTNFKYARQTYAIGATIPDWRTQLVCSNCGMPNHLRAFIHSFLQEFSPRRTARIYVTQRSTMLHKWLEHRFVNLVGSEYGSLRSAPGETGQEFSNGVLENLPFDDSSFDYALSIDVLEHIPDYRLTLKEIFRCLVPGGYFIFTGSADMKCLKNLTRAVANADGSIRHLLEPEYHENPMNSGLQVLCYRYFAWELFDELVKIGYQTPFIFHYWSERFGYLGEEQILFVVQKPTPG